MEKFRHACLVIVLGLAAVLAPAAVYGQCGNDNVFAAAGGVPPCGTDGSVLMGAGTYATFSVVSGATYEFRTCGTYVQTGNLFDSQITGFNGGGGSVFFNDDNSGSFSGCVGCTVQTCADANSNFRDSYARWTSGFSGTLRVAVDKYTCDACAGGVSGTNCPSYGSAILRYKQVDDLAITSSGASMCTGETRTLVATPAGGTFSGTGVTAGVFTAPATAGTYTITYTLGACSETQNISVSSLSVAATSATALPSSTCTPGSNIALSVNGGSLGSGANWQWYSGSCGGTAVNSGANITVAPTSTTTYFVRAEGICGNTICQQVTVTVQSQSTAPTGINATADNFCPGTQTVLTAIGGSLGTGATYKWYQGASCCGTSAGSGSSITVTPSATTTYYVRAEGTCNTTTFPSRTITVKTVSVAPTSILSSNGTSFCSGLANTTLSVNGGSLGTNATWNWYSGSCGGTPVGTTGSINVNPTVTTTYFVRGEGDCGNSTCQQITIRVSSGLAAAPTVTTPIACFGACTGVVAANASGGISPYSYSWSPSGGTGATATNRCTGTYNVLVTDDAGCTVTGSIFIGQPAQLSINSVNSTNLACNGGTTGTITVTASGGTGAIQYSVNAGGAYQNNGNFTNLPAGTYNIQVRDANGCITVYSGNPVILTAPSALSASILGSTNASCNGVNNGSITASASGGSGGYQYSLNGSPLQPGATFNNLSAGTYNVLVQDLNGCQATAGPVTISNSGGVVLTKDSSFDISCNGANDGRIYVSASSGTSPYNYSLNGITFQPTGAFTGLPNGIYTVIVRDAAGCTAGVNDTITQPAQLVAIIDSVHNVGCAGTTTGGVFISVTGGTGPYTYVWTPGGAVSQDLTGVGAGTYSVAVRDSRGCTTTTNATVTAPPALNVSLANSSQVSCNGGNNGELDISVTGGLPPYAYVWSNGPTSEDNINLTAGTYTVTVTDAGGCQNVQSFTVSQPNALVVTGAVTNIVCASSNTGAVDITVTGGTAPYSYVWSPNGAVTQDINNVGPGTYTVNVTDNNGCVNTQTYTVTANAALSATIDNVVNVNCNGATTGAVNVSVTGGTGAYSYAWTPGGAATQDLSGVGAGTYTLIVTDAGGCRDTLVATVTQPAALALSTQVTNANCNGGTGAIDLTVTGGTGTYGYVWTPGGAITQDLNAIAAGTYSVVVTDGNSCTATTTATVTQPAAITSQATITNVSCSGQNTGSISLTVNGGTPSYSYLWSPGGATTSSINNLAAGTYNVTITDSRGCVFNASYQVTAPNALVVTLTPAAVSCFGGNNGSITSTVTGGSTPYTYLWSPGFTTGTSISGLTAGAYNLQVTDANGCQVNTSATVTQPTQVVITETITNVDCNGNASGSIVANASGGTGPYDFSWSTGVTVNGVTTSTITGLTAGNYTLTITDNNGCQMVKTYTVTQPTAISLSAASTNVTCNGGGNGAIDLTVSGGVAPYSYSWTGGAITQDISNLSAGSYTVNVTDDNGCIASLTRVITEPAAINVQGSVSDVSCAGNSNGSILLTVAGGVSPYTYLWSPGGATTQNLVNIAGGTYDVTVTDANGCTEATSFTVNEPAVLATTITSTNVNCFGASTGSIDLAVTGGTTPYQYLWSNFATTQDLNNIPAGTYTVVVTDNNGCRTVDTVTITQNTPLAATGMVENVTCYGQADGSVALTVSGGVSPYGFSWTGGGTTDSIGALTAGTYNVTITDDVGCTLVQTYTVGQPDSLAVSAVITNVTCNGQTNGSIDVSVNGGTTPYTYLWNGGVNTQDRNNLAAGTYTLTLTDGNGCSVVDSFTVTQPAALAAVITAAPVSCNGGANGTASVAVTGGTAPYTYFWSNFRFTPSVSNLSSGEYFVVVTDANGCETIDSITIGEPDALVITGTAKGAGCGNAAEGVVDITVNGGTSPYSYLWSTGDTTQDIANLPAGTYTVTVTDGNSCTASFTGVVSALPKPVASFTYDLACEGLPVNFLNTSTVGTGTISSHWSFGDSDTSNLSDPMHTYGNAGTYLVQLIVTSDRNCADTTSQVISVNALPDATITGHGQTGQVCSGDSITLYAPASGVLYDWSTGEVSESIFVMASGSYSVTVTNASGCTAADTIEVNIFDETDITISADTTISLGFSAQLVATGGVAYAWSPAIGLSDTSIANPIATPLATTTYTVTVSAGTGCISVRQVTVTVDENIVIDAPNVFSPNGDGYHDFWNITNITTFPACELYVYNRWGTEVYQVNDYQNDWTGTNGSDGGALPDGTYYYIIKCGSAVFKGAVTILR